MTYTLKPCRCGSGLLHEPLLDGHGIFLAYVCDRCRQRTLAKYRPDILERYQADEPIDADD